MEDERPGPEVTIRDPNNPTLYGDVLGAGSEREPWRPSRRLLRVLLVVFLVLLVALPPTLFLRHRSQEQAADRRALAALRITAVNEEGGITPAFVFRNDGPDKVTVVSARIDREGYPPMRVDAHIAAGAEATIPLTFDAACPTAVPQSGPTGVRLRVRSSRGDERELRVDIRDTQTSDAFLLQIQDDCGLYEPYESLELEQSEVVRVGRSIEVTGSIHNRSTLRRDITMFAGGGGLQVTTPDRLPFVVPPGKVNEPGPSVSFPLRITVTDCRQARRLANGKDDLAQEFSGGVQAFINGQLPGPAFLYFGEQYNQALREVVALSC